LRHSQCLTQDSHPVMPQPLVSVVIPCYNYGRYLGEALESARRQSYPAVEIIVVDDGSTDDTAKVAAGYRPEVAYFHQENAGPAAARNVGARKATGIYLVYLDADDVLDPAYVERTVREFESARDPRLAFVYTQMTTFGRESTITTFPVFDVRPLLINNYVHATAALRADVVRSNPFDEALRAGLEDWDFFLRLCEQGFTGRLLDAPLLAYRRHGDAGSRQDAVSYGRGQRLRGRFIRKHWRLYLRHGPWYAKTMAAKALRKLTSA
jgi:glycosyltransferase involved in cell wall biosynthesis